MIADIIAGFISGALGAMGFGGGGVLIIYLTLYKDIPQLTAQGINLIFFIPSAAIALVKHNKNKLIEWKISFSYIVCGIIGVAAGFFLIRFLDEMIIRKIFSLILISVGSKELLIQNKE